MERLFHTEAVSYTDDTSLPGVGSKVSIHAQTIRESPLAWFETLSRRAPDHTAELKSKIIVDVFLGLSETERRQILGTLKLVRIHITDPRVYNDSTNKRLSAIVPGGDLNSFLERMDDHFRRPIEKLRRRMVAEDMLRDSPSYQIRLKYAFLSSPLSFHRSDDGMEPIFRSHIPKLPDAAPFERGTKNMVNVLSPTLSKSASVFADANDELDEMIESERYLSGTVSGVHLSRLLSNSHAFDNGDSAEVEWINGERDGLLAEVGRWAFSSPKPLIEIDSVDSVHLQAADFAAGIAREIWHRSGLPRLVGSFDYTTYNGRRISDTEASAIQDRLLKLPGDSPAGLRAREALMRQRTGNQGD